MTSVGMRYRILKSFFKKSRIFVLDTCTVLVDGAWQRLNTSTYIIHDRLVDEPDIGNPLLKVFERIVNICTHSLDDEASIISQYVV